LLRGRLSSRHAVRPGILDKLVKEKTNNVWVQFFRYFLVGGVAFALDFTALILLTEVMGWHYLISAATGFIIGLGTNYYLSVIWVFPRRNISSRRTEFLLFALIGISGLGLNELCIYLFTEQAGIHYIHSKILTTALVYLWNFGARKLTLFR